MTRHKQGAFWNTTLSIMLILLGFLLLLDTFNIIGDATGIFISVMFGLGAFVSISFYLQNRQNWWALIPGGVLLGLSGFFAIDAFPFLNRRVEEVGFMMFAFALAFWIIYATERKQKWAIIPAGLFTFVAIIVSVDRPELFMASIFGVASLFGFQYYLKNQNHWWVLIPSSVLLGVAGVIGLDSLRFLSPRIDEGSFMLFAMALGFWIIYVTQRKHWWAGIPAGILTTIAFMITLDNLVRGLDFEGTFIMVGFGLTFGMLWARRKRDNTEWAIWPASVLTGIGLMISVAEHLDVLWPLILIAVGGWLIRRNFTQNKINAAGRPASPTDD